MRDEPDSNLTSGIVADDMTTTLFRQYMERVERGVSARKKERDLLLVRLNSM